MSIHGAPRGARLVGRYGLLLVVAALVIFPIYTTVIAALKPGNRVLVNPLLPDSFTLEVISEAWTDGRLGRYLFNSFVMAVVITVAQVATSLTSAYAFSMLRFPGRNLLFGVFIATLLVPLESVMFFNRRTVDSLGWLNSYAGLTVPFLATAFGTFLVRQSLLAFPEELRDAARLDGVTHLGFLWRIVVPLSKPTIGALALLSFLASWNQYLWPNLIIDDPDMNTVQSGLRLLAGTRIDAPNLVMAGTLIAAIPVAIVLLVFQRQLVRGLTAGAVKG